MRPHTHTHDVRHTRLPLTSNRTEPRSRSRSCAKRVYVTSPKRHTRHGSCARTARSSQRTQDRMWFDLSSQTATQSRHAEQTRGRRHADARLERSKERRPAAAACPRASPPRPWRRTCRGTARPRLLDLQLPRRRQTSCPALLLVAFGEIEPGMLSSWIQFVSASQGGVHVVCAREAHTVRSVCGAVPTRGATWRYQQPGVHACLHLQCQPGASF